MVFKIIPIKLHHHSINNNNNNSYHLHLPILYTTIHRQTVFQQLLLLHLLFFLLRLSILKKIIFLYSICNIFFKQKLLMSDFSLSSGHHFSNRKNIHIYEVQIFSSICSFAFFCTKKNSDSHSHLHYRTVCNRTKTNLYTGYVAFIYNLY